MRMTVERVAGVTAAALMVLTLSATASRAQSAPRTPPTVAKRDSIVLELPAGRTPGPPRPAASALPSRLQRPTPPVNLPVTPLTAPVDAQRAVSASVATIAPALPASASAQPVPAPPAAANRAPNPATRIVSAVPPAGSTGQCKDGTYLTGAATEQACARHEGLASAFAAPRQAARRP